jgi:hypothetical protein
MAKQRCIQWVYHLADERNWKSIQASGLLSATQLFTQAGTEQWICTHRPQTLQLPTGIIVRDQRPIPPTSLARCLAPGLTPTDWYAELNSRVFFWVELERLERQRRACGTPQYIMTIDAKKLLSHYAASVTVTPFNTGNALRAAAQRSLASFVPYATWVNSGWITEAAALNATPRSRNHSPVEFTISQSVPSIFDFVTAVRSA